MQPKAPVHDCGGCQCLILCQPGGLPIDGDPVNIFFVVLRPERATDSHDPEHHIERMSWIARLGRQADFRSFVQRTNTKAEMLGLLKEMSAV